MTFILSLFPPFQTVLSPLCGMETKTIRKSKTHYCQESSEPTAWDGNALASWIVSVQILYSGSKPTVWDGDYIRFAPVSAENFVLSPPCGMVTKLEFQL